MLKNNNYWYSRNKFGNFFLLLADKPPWRRCHILDALLNFALLPAIAKVFTYDGMMMSLKKASASQEVKSTISV